MQQPRFQKASHCQPEERSVNDTISLYFFQQKLPFMTAFAPDWQQSTRPVKELRIFRSWISRAIGRFALPFVASGRWCVSCVCADAQAHGFLVVLLVIGARPATARSTLTGSFDALHRSPALFTSSIASPGGKQAVRRREAGRKSATVEGNTRWCALAQTAWSKA